MSMLGVRIREQRVARGMTLRQLSKASGVAFGHICAVENGKKPNPGVYTLKKILAPLGMTIDDALKDPSAIDVQAWREEMGA